MVLTFEFAMCYTAKVFKPKVLPDSFVLKDLIELNKTFPCVEGDVVLQCFNDFTML